jgi:hypothetical protein
MNDRIHQFIKVKRVIKEMRGYNLKGFLVFRAFPEGSLGPAQIRFQLLMLKSKKYFMLDFVYFPFAKKPSRAKVTLIAETTIKAQLINRFQAVKIKIRPIAFLLPTLTPKKRGNMSRIFS